MKKREIRKVLVISLTNIGDVVLTCPVIDAIVNHFPLVEVSIVVGPKTKTLFENNPYIKNVYILTKKEGVFEFVTWMWHLWRQRFDVVIDLRNTAMGYFLFSKYRTSAFSYVNTGLHKRDQHWQRFQRVFPEVVQTQKHYAIFIDETARKRTEDVLRLSPGQGKGYCVVAAGAADTRKRWTAEGFARVCKALIQEQKLIVFLVGDMFDQEEAEKILQQLPAGAVNLCGKLSLRESAWVLRNARFALCNDSAVMHLASYFDVPVVALFGPTEPKIYGPWGSQGCFVRARKDTADTGNLMTAIDPEEVLKCIRTHVLL